MGKELGQHLCLNKALGAPASFQMFQRDDPIAALRTRKALATTLNNFPMAMMAWFKKCSKAKLHCCKCCFYRWETIYVVSSDIFLSVINAWSKVEWFGSMMFHACSERIPALGWYSVANLSATHGNSGNSCENLQMWLPRPSDTGRVEEELSRNAKRSGLAARCVKPCTPQIGGSWLNDWHGGVILHPNRSRRGEPV